MTIPRASKSLRPFYSTMMLLALTLIVSCGKNSETRIPSVDAKANIAAGSYDEAQNVAFTVTLTGGSSQDPPSDLNLYYTLDGSEPTRDSDFVTFDLSQPTTVEGGKSYVSVESAAIERSLTLKFFAIATVNTSKTKSDVFGKPKKKASTVDASSNVVSVDYAISTGDTSTIDDVAPVVGASISYSLITMASMRIGFGAATDNTTPPEDLEYKMVTAETTGAIDTIAEAEAATVLSDWSASSNHFIDATSLTAGTEYCQAVLVRDAAHNMAIYAPSCESTVSMKRMFTTTSTYTGAQIGGLSGADAICTNDPFNTFGSTFKAMLVVFGGARVACVSTNCETNGAAENVDWVMAPNTTYYNARNSNAEIGTTNAAGVIPLDTETLNLTNPFSSVEIWTGMNHGWDAYSGGDCSAWTDVGGVTGYGLPDRVDAYALSDSSVSSCSNARALLCVEQ